VELSLREREMKGEKKREKEMMALPRPAWAG